MTENKDDSQRLHIVVDATKLSRCIWCGTVQSDDWLITERGLYCSDTCIKASRNREHYKIAALLIFIMLSSFFIAIFLLPQANQTRNFVASVGLFVVGSLAICCWSMYPEEDYAKRVPKDSRWNEGYSDLSLLRTVMSHAVCPNCDGNIDLSKVKEDMVYHCDYCGADGIVEIVKMEQ